MQINYKSSKNVLGFLKYAFVATCAFVGMTNTFATSTQLEGMRNQRYCEVLTSESRLARDGLHIFNTIGLNECPEALWSKLTPEEIKQQMGTPLVRLNGPRYWVIDGLKNSTLVNPKIVNFGGIEMREAGVLQISFMDLMQGAKPYKPRTVDRNTTWVYLAGKPIYELIDPENNVYVMQSYSVEKREQTLQSLAQLGDQLTLPAGWHFRTRVLQKDAFLTPIDKKAVVVQDNFLNTYQQETPDFIKST